MLEVSRLGCGQAPETLFEASNQLLMQSWVIAQTPEG